MQPDRCPHMPSGFTTRCSLQNCGQIESMADFETLDDLGVLNAVAPNLK